MCQNHSATAIHPPIIHYRVNLHIATHDFSGGVTARAEKRQGTGAWWMAKGCQKDKSSKISIKSCRKKIPPVNHGMINYRYLNWCKGVWTIHRVFSEKLWLLCWWFIMVESVKNHQKIKSKKYKFQKEKKGLYTGTGYSPCKWQKMVYKWGLLTTC